MGILRADRITGLGGADAIKGSVFFGGGGGLVSPESDDFKFCAGGDFTIEAWVNTFEFGNAAAIVACWDQTGADGSGEGGDCWLLNINTSGVLQLAWSPHATDVYFITGGTLTKDTWHHVAVTRNGNTFRIFLDGTQTATGTNSSTNNTNSELFIGRYGGYGLDYYWHGNISNVRILKGEALYTSTFTPPNRELTVTPNTVLVACQSPGNISQEATGKHLSIIKKNVNDAPPVASSFTPDSPVGFSTTTDVGGQYGSTFDGFGNFATSTYMVPPGGNTRERNRGRALFGGGSTIDNTIQSLNIQSQGNTENFGDLSTGRYETECASSSTRGIWGGGYTESPNVKVDVVEFVTIANSSNTTDFGNLTVARGHLAGMCNSTRGVFANGTTNPSPHPVVNTIDYITIATAGNATNFGDSTTASKPMGGGRSSTTRGIFTLGNAPSAVNNIEYITIASTGDSQDFGDLTGFSGWGKGAGNISSGTRAILGGGHEALNNIEYITIASLGNGTDFGDLIGGRRSAFTAGSKTRGVIAGGKTPSQINNIEYVEIATTGNALDFGDMINSKSFSSGLSDCHGGLS